MYKKTHRFIDMLILSNVSITYLIYHFIDRLDNTKNNELQKYTEEQHEADLQKWANGSKYTKGDTKWTEKYAHTFKKFSGEIKEKKIVISPKLLENNISIQKTEIMSATPINTENLDITEMMQNK